MSAGMGLIADLTDAHAIATGAQSTAPKPCDACLDGDGPDKCVAVSCWRCGCGCRDRRTGVRSPAAGAGHDHREGT